MPDEDKYLDLWYKINKGKQTMHEAIIKLEKELEKQNKKKWWNINLVLYVLT